MENWKFALSSIMGHKMRAFLTMLGIIIGVAAVVVIMALGDGMRESVTKSLSQNSQEIQIYFDTMGWGETQGILGAEEIDFNAEPAEPPIFNENWIKQVVEEFDDIDGYYVTNSTISAVASSKRTADSVNITGVNQTYFAIKKYNILAGRQFQVGDYRQFARVIMLDTQLAVKLFGSNEDALNKIVEVGERSYLVVGVYEDPNVGTSIYGMTSDGNAMMTNTQLAAEYMIDEAQAIYIYVEDVVQGPDLGRSAAIRLTQLSGVSQGNYSIFDMSQIVNEINQQVSVMTGIIGSIAGIALLVGGIGVMNIMLVSVTERTREIGLRKALGATRRNILSQFLIEAMVLTMMGGLIGLILAFGITSLLGGALSDFMSDVTIRPSLKVAIISIIFSAFIGILFGLLPANKASKLDPIEALRYE